MNDGPGSVEGQDVADRALRNLFAGARRPELPPFFAQRCARRASLPAPARPLGVRERAILRVYWVLTLVVACVVMARTEWPATVAPAIAAAAIGSAAVVLMPILLLVHLRGGVLALMRRVLG
jgi:hypothetical protein